MFENDEIRKYPKTVLNVIIKQTYQPKKSLVTDEKAKEILQKHSNIKTGDPSGNYNIRKQLGKGG